jgi:5-methylcytosine-specific restriction endonuclease McrA
MNRKTEFTVRRRAGGFCEYCRSPESLSHLPFTLDHIVARQHGGQSTQDNLALACPECNLHKGPNITGIDPKTKALTRLFDPRAANELSSNVTKSSLPHGKEIGEFIGFASVGRIRRTFGVVLKCT